MTQLRDLAEPFKGKLVRGPAPGKYGDYVKHSTITERLLSILGPFDFEIVDIVRGDVPEFTTRGKEPKTYPARQQAIVGVVGRITATIDGRVTTVAEAGSEDTPQMHHDGDCLKNAASDALKRCAMRLGLGLHLWSDDLYFLDKQLDHDERPVMTFTLPDDMTVEERNRFYTEFQNRLDESSTGGGEPVGGEADTDTPTQRGLLDD